MSRKRVGIGIIGGGLMGRELAAAIGRWDALEDHPVRPVLVGVCDPNPVALDWFDRIDTVGIRTAEHEALLAADEVDVVYIAVPHHLHERIYLDTINARKDFLGEKPFGIDRAASERIVNSIESHPGLFARCSSEMPYFPGAQFAVEMVVDGAIGQPIEARSAFLHSSDTDRTKKINWKRQTAFCGPTGVMADLGMHVLHVPLRLGWRPHSVFAVLQDIVPERPGPDGRPVKCDTIDNATLLCTIPDKLGPFPLTLETKRIAPGQMNTWVFRCVGMDGGVEFSTRYPQTVRRFAVREGRQVWEEVQVGSQSCFPTVTGGIFEAGFSDAILQMWAAFLAERAGELGDAFGCARPREALDAHVIFEAALDSAADGRAIRPFA